MNDEPFPEADRAEGVPHPRQTVQLFGQGVAEAAFLEAHATGRLHHGWLLSGPRGIGKATLAWRIARFLRKGDEAGLFGDASLPMDPDDPVFRRVEALSEPGLALCRRSYDEKAKRLKTTIGVDDVRRMKSFFTLSATDGGWRVAIIDAMDEMNVQASNALLKLLEEPPARTIFLMVCHRPAMLLPTIRSRCRTLPLAPLGADDLAAALDAAGVVVEDPETIATLSEGSVGEALRLLEGNGLEIYRTVLTLLGQGGRMDRAGILSLADSVAGRDREIRYDTTLRLIPLAIMRLTRARAGAPGAPPVAAEAEVVNTLAQTLPGLQRLAALIPEINQRAAHARAVNLDPGQVILDMMLRVEKTLRQVS